MMFNDVFLSSRQISGLKWLKEGWSLPEIANKQKISLRIVNNYIAEARLRLDVLWKEEIMNSENTLISPKQIECLRWLMDGYTVSEIAEKLDLSSETVKTHLAIARKRLGAKNSIEAIVYSIKLGIFEI